MDKQKKRIMWTILIIAVIQMPALALTPGINQIVTTAFSDRSLGAVQSALAISGLAQPVAAFGAAIIMNKRLVTKKAVIIFGLFLLTATGLTAVLLHTEFWNLILLSAMLGISTGCFMSNMFGLIFDNFNEEERQAIVGYQTSVINVGGIMMSLLGGLLATYMWYGGYLMLFVGLPASVLVMFFVPNYKVPAAESGGSKSAAKMDPKIFYYCAIVFLFMMAYSACGSNISTHIAGMGNSATAGVAVAFMMGGGVVSGVFFEKLSKKAGDYSMTCALCLVFAGYMMLSVFTSSLALTFAAVFIVGTSLSIMLPRCIFMVSTLALDRSTSSTATALISVVAPSAGSFMSPIIITNLTTALFGQSTAARYRFLSFVVLTLAALIALATYFGNKEKAKG